MKSRGATQKIKITILVLISASLITPLVYPHPGRTDRDGCHTCRTNCEGGWGIPYGFYHRHDPVRACFEEPTTSLSTTTTTITTTTTTTTTTVPTTTPPLTTSPLETTASEINRSNRTLLGSAYGVEGRIERTPEPVETPELTTTPAPITTAPEPTLYESEPVTTSSDDTKGACGPSAIVLLAMLPLVGARFIKKKNKN